MGQEINSYKESADEALKAHFSIIHREGQKLFIGTGHLYYYFAKAEEAARECERGERESQLVLNTEIEVEERYAIELMQELEAELGEEKKGEKVNKELVTKKPRLKARTRMPMEAKIREEDLAKVSKRTSPIKGNVVVRPDVNFFEEPIIPKEEPIDCSNIPLQFFLIEKEDPPQKKRKIKARKMVNAPNPAKEPEKKDDYLFITNIEEFSEFDLQLNDLVEVNGIDATSRLPERLVFVYRSSTDVI